MLINQTLIPWVILALQENQPLLSRPLNNLRMYKISSLESAGE